MPMQVWPRSIRYQLLGGLVLLEALSISLFGVLLLHKQEVQIHARAQQRLAHQADSLALQAEEAIDGGDTKALHLFVRMTGDAPSVKVARITDAKGKVLVISGDATAAESSLSPAQLAVIPRIAAGKALDFELGADDWEAVKPLYLNHSLFGYAWVQTDSLWDQNQLNSTRSSTVLFGVIWICASLLLAWGLGRSITNPLAVLHRGTRALMQSPEGHVNFPLPVTVANEIGELIEAFNRMVASIEEQRAGLNDTLSLLDSMLANAPIGLAFFDRKHRFVRVNRIFAESTGMPLSRHLGRTLSEMLPFPVAHQLEKTIDTVFKQDIPLRDLEVTGEDDETTLPWTWIINAYPIHTMPEEVRWVGLIVMDASDRKRSEEALRRSEKLAATGRLAASIAHEINNPLEAITNLLYLVSNYTELDTSARKYIEMTEHEVRRISEITQQTLGFYRQSTLPGRANLADLLNSILSLHQSRLRNLGIRVEKKYDAAIDLYCFSGELRQVFANLVGNAIDAMPQGGRLVVRARRSQHWKQKDVKGVRLQVADTGMGMKRGVEKRIFEPFFHDQGKRPGQG